VTAYRTARAQRIHHSCDLRARRASHDRRADPARLGPAIAKPLHAIRCYRQYRTLYPLWRDLYAANPSILLAKTPYVARPVRGLDQLVGRLVIEIPDGMQRLTPYYAAEVAAEVGTLHGIDRNSDMQAMGGAMRVAAALHAHDIGTQPERTADFPYGTGATGDEQLRWLLAVARHFRHDPIVRAYRSGSNTLGESGPTSRDPRVMRTATESRRAAAGSSARSSPRGGAEPPDRIAASAGWTVRIWLAGLCCDGVTRRQ